MTEPKILAATYGKIAAVRLIGRASFKVSRALRDFGMQVITDGVESIIFDLKECTGMDSTILGVFAMIGLESRNKIEVVVVNCSESVFKALDGVGVSRLCKFAEKPADEMKWSSLCEAAAGAMDMADVAETVLEAHKVLMELDEENVPKFKDVVELLEKEIH